MSIISISDDQVGVWVEATTGDATTVGFQVVGDHAVEVARGATSAPAGDAGFWRYEPGEGDRGAVSDLFPGGSGSRIWIRSTAATSLSFEAA